MGFNNKKRSNAIWLLAHNEGDEIYKSVVQQFELKFPLRNTQGITQEISFEAIPNSQKNVRSIALRVTSNAGLPIYFYVKEGPAFIKNQRLVFTKIPPKSKMPLKVTVVAWQYGIIGKVQSAEPVEQSFWIEK
jgi:hypothetical protein